MSATMGYTPVATLSHELETLLDRVRRGARTIDAQLMQLLFRAADVLEGAIEAAVSGQPTAGDVDPVVALLRAASEDHTASAAPADAAKAGARKSRKRTSHPAKATDIPSGWTAPTPAGDGLLVRIRLAEGTPLRGVRAFLVVQAARALGTVTAT